jgi:hypothetical protein
MRRHALGAVLLVVFVAAACTALVYTLTSQSQPVRPVAAASRAATAPRTVTVTAGTIAITDPWAVVSAYYGDIESGDYPGAWALLDYGKATGQTYQQFVAGYACTGAQTVTENWESGSQVSFSLAATDKCRNLVQDYSVTDTVTGGKIVAANVSETA